MRRDQEERTRSLRAQFKQYWDDTVSEKQAKVRATRQRERDDMAEIEVVSRMYPTPECKQA